MCKRKIPLDGSKARCELNADQAKPADIIEAIVPFLESTFAAMDFWNFLDHFYYYMRRNHQEQDVLTNFFSLPIYRT